MNITNKLNNNNNDRFDIRSKAASLEVLRFKETYSWFFIIEHFDKYTNLVSIFKTSGNFQEFILYKGVNES